LQNLLNLLVDGPFEVRDLRLDVDDLGMEVAVPRRKLRQRALSLGKSRLQPLHHAAFQDRAD
jgi:hypothetical protein